MAATAMTAEANIEYLMSRSKALRETDPVRSKAWMITAQMAFPGNFSIQYEAYIFQKEIGSDVSKLGPTIARFIHNLLFFAL